MKTLIFSMMMFLTSATLSHATEYGCSYSVIYLPESRELGYYPLQPKFELSDQSDACEICYQKLIQNLDNTVMKSMIAQLNGKDSDIEHYTIEFKALSAKLKGGLLCERPQ